MKLYFDKEIDYAEVFFKSTKNYGVDLSETLTQFRDEETEEVVGYGFSKASETVLVSEFVSDEVKKEFTVLLKGGRKC